MSSTEQTQPISGRWPLAFWFGAAFCFFIFPVFLVDVGLENMLSTRAELQRQAVYRNLGQQLERLLQYGNSRHYYSALLKRIFDFAKEQKDPVAYLKAALPHLKARNEGVFQFIVWDGKGNSINELTDEKGYRYIVKTIYEVMTDINKSVSNNYPGEPQSLDSVSKRLNLMRSYLGAFLIPEKLNLPLLRGSLSECILASGDPQKSHFWYQIDSRFSLLATISNDAIESGNYLKKLVDSMNSEGSSIKFGITDLLRENAIYSAAGPDQKPELILGLAKFENYSQQQLETDNYLLLVRILNPFVRCFAYISKNTALLDTDGLHNRLLLAAAGGILTVSLMVLFILFRGTRLISIRWKLGLLFLYANGLPLMILGFIGYEYLQENRRLLLDQAFEQVSGLITDFDSRFETIKLEIAAELNTAVDDINRRYDDRMPPKEELAKLLKIAEKHRIYDFVSADRQGKLYFTRMTGRKSNNFFASVSKIMLDFLNFNEFTPQHLFREDTSTAGGGGKIKVESFLSGKTIIFHRLLHRVRKIHPEQMGAEAKQYYWNMIGSFEKRIFNLLIGISWDFVTLQETFVKRNLNSLNQNSNNIRFQAIIESNGMTYPESSRLPASMFSLFRQTFNLRTLRLDEVTIDGVPYAAFGTVGKELDRVATVGLYPLETINQRIDSIRFRLIIFALLSLGITAGVGRMLSAQFMEPVKEIEKGVQAIGRQDFRYRLPVTSADEFGRLSAVFNRAIESLEDLEVAKIVQENLFPQESLNQNGLQIFGRSVTMTRLGGDYYDFFSLDNRRVGVLMGDVAGHGVPAAMLMAMAKASVLLSSEEKFRPAMMLAMLHKVIHRVKSSKIKRMMTCQYFSIDSSTGEYLVSNAGHCFPAVIKKGGKSVELLNLVGTPLGITKKPKYEDVAGQLEAGDIVLLYTDGIIESHNDDGLEMGYDRFTQLLQTIYDPDPETFYHRIFAGYKQWSPTADDDITMLLIKFDPAGGAA